MFPLSAEEEQEERGAAVRATPHPHGGNSRRKLPRHIEKMKSQAEQRRKRPGLEQSLPTLNRDLERNKSIEILQNQYSESFSESSETESQQDNGSDFVGFKKTRDFGDFVTFSNSPSQV